MESIYYSAVEEAAAIGATVYDFNPDKPFSFDDYPTTKERLDKLIQWLQNKIEATIENGINSAWFLANLKNNDLCDTIFGSSKMLDDQFRMYYNNNDNAREAFLKRKIGGLNLSDRVWKYSTQFRDEIEMGLDLGLRAGVSAVEMARDLKQYLQYPNKLFRRVRDEHGVLRLSKSAKKFHPGRGVYRSSFKNARRLAATETNIAYRSSDYERWQQLDFVVGIEVKLSNNHTLNGVPFTDICDDLKGKYPKAFKFTGWHPLCRCHVISILKTEDEMDADFEARLAGKEPSGHSVNEVTDVPEGFKKWIDKNSDRIANAESGTKGTLPYFIKDNRSYWQPLTRRKGDTTDNIDKYQRVNSVEDIFKKLKELDSEIGLRKIEVSKGKDLGATDGMGNIELKKNLYETFYNAVDKLMQGKSGELTSVETQAILTYWHERTHNLTTKSYLTAIYTGDQKNEMELAIEFIAQKTLPDFYKMFGAEMPEKINSLSGYATMTDNYQTAVSKLIEIGDIKEENVIQTIKEHIINGELGSQRKGLVEALYGAKINGEIIDRRKLNSIITKALKCPGFQFERKLNKILGLT
jgi:hypothetical protein